MGRSHATEVDSVERVGLTPGSREQMERFRAAHATQVLTILLSDIEGSTRQQGELGNVRAAELVVAHRAVVRQVLAGVDGEEVETAGDSFLLVFAAPSEAVRFALRLQAALRNERARDPAVPAVRIGIHQGQVVVQRHEDGPKRLDIYGLQVSTTARITDLARGGQVLCTRAVFDDARAILNRDDLAGLAPVAWCNHGPYRFKGVADAYEVCEVGETGLAPLAPPPPTAKSWPADQAAEELGWRPAVGVTVPETNWVLEKRLGAEKAPGGGPRNYRGEFGEVWRAWNPSDKSRQVFKFCFKRDHLPILKREARLLKRLRKHRHPNLVEVYDVTEHDRPPYYLEMEYVEGPTLAEWLAEDPPLGDRLEIIAQVADALDTVHAAGIYHRDIKPSNILLTRRQDGALLAKLSDFGLGAAEDEELLRSLASSRVEGVAGTWDYIAPELRRGAPPSAQSDLYSLGVTLYQVVCGDLRRTLGDWEQHVPSEVLRDDIRRAIASDPAQRWPRAADLSRALRSHGQRLRQRQLEREREAHRRRAARLARIAGLAALFALVVAGLGGYAWHARGVANRRRAEALRAQERVEGELYYSNILLADKSAREVRFDLARRLLWATPEARRNWEWGYLLGACYADLITLDAGGQSLNDVDVGPAPPGARGGLRIVAAGSDGEAIVWDAATGRPAARLRGHAKWLASARFSPDGSRVLTASGDGTARLWDAATGRTLVTLAGHYPPIAVGAPADPRLGDGSREAIAKSWEGISQHDLFKQLKDSPVAVRFIGGAQTTWERLPRQQLAQLMVALDQARSLVCARMSRDGSRVVTASGDGTARVWDAATGACRAVIGASAQRPAEPGGPRSCQALCRWLYAIGLCDAAFSPDGRRVVTASRSGTAAVWDAATGRRVAAMVGHRGAVNSARFSPDGERIVTASADHTVRVWNAASGAELAKLEEAEQALAAEFMPDGARVVASFGDGTARIWSPGASARPATFYGRQAAFSPDGSLIAAVRLGGVSLVEAATGRETLRYDGHGDLVSAAAFAPDGAWVATASGDGTVKLWPTRRDDAPLHVGSLPGPLEHAEASPDGRYVLVVAPGIVWVFDTGSGRRVAGLPGREGIVAGSHLSADGTRLAAVGRSGVVVWDIARQRVLCEPPYDGAVNAARFSPDGSQLVAAADDGTARLWNAATGAALRTLEGHADAVWDAEFSADGSLLVTASNDTTARVWDVATGAALAVLRGHGRGLYGATFSQDARRVVTTSADGTARVWDTRTGRQVATLEAHDAPPRHACFSPDGARVLTCAPDGTARVWDASTGRELHVLRGHASGVYRARFSPDGARIVTAGDMTARVWDAGAGRELVVLRGHRLVVRDAAFSSDGRTIITASDDGTVRFWTPAPWRLSELPGDASANWKERFGLWRRQRYHAWLARTGPARR